jgi:hypothetical protein
MKMKGEDREDEWKYRSTIHDLGNRWRVVEVMPRYFNPGERTPSTQWLGPRASLNAVE